MNFYSVYARCPNCSNSSYYLVAQREVPIETDLPGYSFYDETLVECDNCGYSRWIPGGNFENPQ